MRIKREDMVIVNPENYSELRERPELKRILENIPDGLSKIEKAYYVYIELGKIMKEDPNFVYSVGMARRSHYNDKINDEYFGICKSISELYVAMLSDERVGVEAESVKVDLDSELTHVDTILKIDGRIYLANLISDLSRIKTSRRVNSFGEDLTRNPKAKEYLQRLESLYGQEISSLSTQEREKLDVKMGYSFTSQRMRDAKERGVYTEDTLEILRRDFENKEHIREYLLPKDADGNPIDVEPEEILKYKLDFIFEHIGDLTNFKGRGGYLEIIRYYMKVAEKVLSPEEKWRIQAYAVVENGDISNIQSIIQLKMSASGERTPKYIYYRFSKGIQKYDEMTLEQAKDFLNGLREKKKGKLKIIGVFDRPGEIDDGEIEW